MERKQKDKKYKRARTSSQKADRREAIIYEADNHLRDFGLEGFSMGVLAKNVGIARATLYLYFETREELLLTLYAKKVTSWSESLLESVYDGIDDETFLRHFMMAFKNDPLFYQLLSRLGDVIEQNVSIERLIESKRFLNKVISEITVHFSKTINLDQEQATDLLISLLVLMTGVTQIDSGPQIDPKLLPDDLQAMANVTSEGIYMTTGQLILSGIRSAQ